jgi:hypothetical protein
MKTCPLPSTADVPGNHLWRCPDPGCGWVYRLNPIVHRWYRYIPYVSDRDVTLNR